MLTKIGQAFVPLAALGVKQGIRLKENQGILPLKDNQILKIPKRPSKAKPFTVHSVLKETPHNSLIQSPKHTDSTPRQTLSS